MANKTPQQTDAEKKLNKTIQLKEDYISVFSTAAGKRVFEDLLKATKFNEPSALSAMFQTNGTFFNDGLKSVIYHIQNTQNIDIKHERVKVETQLKQEEE